MLYDLVFLNLCQLKLPTHMADTNLKTTLLHRLKNVTRKYGSSDKIRAWPGRLLSLFCKCRNRVGVSQHIPESSRDSIPGKREEKHATQRCTVWTTKFGAFMDNLTLPTPLSVHISILPDFLSPHKALGGMAYDLHTHTPNTVRQFAMCLSACSTSNPLYSIHCTLLWVTNSLRKEQNFPQKNIE